MSDSKVNHKIQIKENQEFHFQVETMDKIRRLIARYPLGKQKSALIPILHIAQEENGGHLTVDVMDYVAELLEIQAIEVYEVATFYTQFYIEKLGRYVIELCQTSSCAICGGEDILDYLKEKLNVNVGETTTDGLFTLRTVECLGGCGYAPVMQVNTEFYEFLDRQKIDKLLDKLRSKVIDKQENATTWAEKYC